MLVPLFADVLIKLTGVGGTSDFAVYLQRYQNHEFEQAVINISLGVVITAITLSIILTMLFPPQKDDEKLKAAEDASEDV
ncbi:MAG: hypothetical protein H0V90_10265 [Blastocatellia bacterium]|nr:hypothetical protein [Blastocatellia bacterium]